ncbi:ATP-binding cassette domain-containing protein [Euhalothece natronophila Z-M001]|uniref:ATP-binding cassette domain-containing protein n=1 Tax=Euhalothece natronophila Z-M001 TaxID=522448 RepID=A0A5B8NQG6_9CHRO|nr:ATP-binding cassette domain-containing protein [Euhalothece natronophila]QDZ40791.1 ATP-binding cassette domain-containing protein [Euhalothece natronophila Z-M001]
MGIVEIQQLTRRFKSAVAVDSLNLVVEAGEIFGLLGPNGAGKSTTIKMLTTLLPVTSGEVKIKHCNLTQNPAQVRQLIGYVPQSLSVDGSLTGYENLLMVAKLYNVPRQQQKTRIGEALAYVALEDASRQLVKRYSGGMIRRLEIAQALLHQPAVLFMDEPTVGLDPVARNALWELLKKIRTQLGTTIFLTTHFMEEADYLCDRVGIMHYGRLVAMGSPNELKASISEPEATLDRVFIHYTGDNLEARGNYRDISQTRSTARRLG